MGNDYYNNKGGVLLDYRNGSCTSVTPPSVGVDWKLTGVHFTSADEGWAVGTTENITTTAGVLLHYQSGAWTSVTPPSVSESWSLTGVHFTSADEGWAVGTTGGSGVLLHYQNGSWTSVTPPPVIGTSWNLAGVHFTSADEGWAVGTTGYAGAGAFWYVNGVLLHYQSGTWTSVPPPSVPWNRWYLAGVHFTSADEGWAVGYDEQVYGGVLLHYQSGTWTSVTPPNIPNDPIGDYRLEGVHFTSADEGWAVGWNGYSSGSGGALLHYQDGKWTSVPPPDFPTNGGRQLYGVHFTSAGEGWVVGTWNDNYVNTKRAALLHYLPLSPYEGTIGTILTITAFDFGSKKGKVSIGGLAAKIAKDSWANDRIVSLITKVPLQSGRYDVTIIPRESTSPIILSNGFTVKDPELDPLTADRGRIDTPITITGKFFSTKGKVYIEDPVSGKKKNCKITYWYMHPTTGDSTMTFVVPKLPKGFSSGVAYPLKVSNKIDTAETTFTVDP